MGEEFDIEKRTCVAPATSGYLNQPDNGNKGHTPVVKITPTKAYVQVILLFSCICFSHVPYFSLASLQTSLNGTLGAVSVAFAYISWIVACLLTQNIISLLGLKVTIVSHHWLICLYVLGYYYRSWPTLLLSNIVIGYADGPAIATASVYANIIACSLAQAKHKDAKHYVGLFQGLVTSGALCGGAVLGNGVSALTFLLEGSQREGNATISVNFTNFSIASENMTKSDFCYSEYAQQTVSDKSYYILVGVCTVFQLISMISVIGIMDVSERAAACKSFKNTMLCFRLRTSVIGAFKTLVTVKYMLVMPIGLYCGIEIGYVLAVYSKVFIAQCLGIGFIGVGTMLYFLSSALSAVIAAKVMIYTSRAVCSIFLFIWTLTLLLFMMLWTREPSYIVILSLSVGMGVSNGSWYTLGSDDRVSKEFLSLKKSLSCRSSQGCHVM